MLKSTLAALFLAAASVLHATDISNDLNKAQTNAVGVGETVVVTTPVADSPWPSVRVYTRVNAPVDTMKEVFLDYKNSPSFLTNLISATVVNQPAPNIYDVRYVNKLPIVGSTTSTVRNWYSQDGDALVVNWNLLSSPLAEKSTGQLRVEPLGTGKSLMRYTNYVVPKSSLAVLAKNAALSEVKATVAALKKEAERRAAAQ